MIPTLLGIMLISFLLTANLIGSNPNEISAFGDGDALDSFYELINAGDNKGTKFIRYCYDIITKGDVGIDTGDIVYRFKHTVMLASLGFAAAVIIGLPAGLVSAVRHNGWQDHVLSVATQIMASIPSFCLALFLVLIFSLYLKLLPAFGFESWKGYILPTMVLGAGGIALTARMTRSAVLEILNMPYVTTLRAKGLSEKSVLWVHVLKNAISPIISVLSNIAISVLCSTLVVENFFSIAGMGSFVVNAVGRRSQRQVLACVLILATTILLLNFCTDICYVLANPQLRMRYGKKTAAGEKGGEQNHG